MEDKLAHFSRFWESGRYVLHFWTDRSEDLLDNCMIYDIVDFSVVSFDNDELSYAIKARMRNGGVPILKELPPGENIMEKAIRELMDLDMDDDTFGRAYEELRQLKKAGMSAETIQQRLDLIKANYSK
jgi:hypothetical protein